ncbi:hypothetical protein H0E87_011695, partial [Populus deltoides]
SFAMGIMFQSPPHLAALLTSFVLGSVYSIELPLLGWKKQAFLAATCIMIVRAIVVQLAFFVHMQKFVLGKPIVVARSLMFATAFMCFFSGVVALFKHLSASNLQPEMNWLGHNRGYVDIPDVDGDRDYGIQSFSVSVGQESDQQGHGTANIKSKVSPSIQHLFAWRVLQESSRLFINIYSVNCKLSSF